MLIFRSPAQQIIHRCDWLIKNIDIVIDYYQKRVDEESDSNRYVKMLNDLVEERQELLKEKEKASVLIPFE
jgi:hypothetical protein